MPLTRLEFADTLQAALTYASWGWYIMPIRTGQKRPAINDWPNEASIDEARIRSWWEAYTVGGVLPNVGLLTGKKSGVVVLDVDPRNGGDKHIEELLAWLKSKHDQCVPTAIVKTGGGGTHFYFKRTPEILYLRSRSGQKGIRDGIELKSDDPTMVVLPPSVHQSGAAYTWEPLQE